MNYSELKFLIKECVQEVMQESGLIRACPYCDILNPPTSAQKINRSHGFACKEHAVKVMERDWGIPVITAKKKVADMIQKNPDAFPSNTSGAKETDPLPEIPKKQF